MRRRKAPATKGDTKGTCAAKADLPRAEFALYVTIVFGGLSCSVGNGGYRVRFLKASVGGLLATLAIVAAGQAAEPVVAQLETALNEPLKIVAGGAVFNCQDARCVARARTNQTLSVSACKQLAKRVGVITAFGDSRDKLPPEKLAACRPNR